MVPGTVNAGLHTFRSAKFKSVVREAIRFFEKTPVHPLPPASGFLGVGVYALYYIGESELYDHIAALNREDCTQPIYVGKAVPLGWRAARASPDERTRSLYGRLPEHTQSILQANNLEVDDFRYRFVILKGIETDLVTAIETQLIRRYAPFWNTLVDGFGNHDPGKGRYNQTRSEWDVLHPGRAWADRLTGPSPRLQDVMKKIRHQR